MRKHLVCDGKKRVNMLSPPESCCVHLGLWLVQQYRLCTQRLYLVFWQSDKSSGVKPLQEMLQCCKRGHLYVDGQMKRKGRIQESKS